MTILKLKNVNYKDFKGITHFEFEIQEKNAVVAGQNGTGKTSLLDGWLWLLLGKDSRGSKLNPKPLDANNQEKLGLEPTVEAVAILNGKEVKLKKVQQEKWTQPRGQLEKERGNDTNKYFIDDVPVKEKEFKEFIGKICEEELVRILSDSTYFMTLKWEKRRQYLMQLARISEQEIVEQVGGQDLVELLDGKTAEERLKIVKAQIAEVKRNIEGLPAKIQENSDMQQQLRESLGNYESIIDKQNSLIDELKKAENEHLTKISADPMADTKKELIRLEMKLSEARNSHTTRWQAEVNILQKEVFEKKAKLTRISDAMEEKQRAVLNHESAVERLTNLIKTARSEWAEVKGTNFDEHLEFCPTCKQKLPEENIEQLVADFNQNKAEKLESIQKSGEKYKKQLLTAKAELESLTQDISKLSADFSDKKDEYDIAKENLDELISSVPTFESTDEYQTISKEIDACKSQINQEVVSVDTHETQQKIVSIRKELTEITKALGRFDDLKRYDIRIEELREEDKKLKIQNAELNKQKFMLEEYTRNKIKLLEYSINNKFKLVKFKLFKQLKNGGYEECCEATYNGVEYNAGLNTGARINCDLDIINTFSNELEIKLPLFIDNTESVTNLEKPDTQIIELKVTNNQNLEVTYHD